MHITLRRNQIGQHPEIGEPSRIGLLRRVAADALVEVALRVVFPGLVQAGFVDLGMLRDVGRRLKLAYIANTTSPNRDRPACG